MDQNQSFMPPETHFCAHFRKWRISLSFFLAGVDREGYGSVLEEFKVIGRDLIKGKYFRVFEFRFKRALDDWGLRCLFIFVNQVSHFQALVESGLHNFEASKGHLQVKWRCKWFWQCNCEKPKVWGQKFRPFDFLVRIVKVLSSSHSSYQSELEHVSKLRLSHFH